MKKLVTVLCAAIGLWHGFAHGEKILVIYKPGIPDNIAPALMMQEAKADLKTSHMSKQEAEQLLGLGYDRIVTFDTYMSSDRLAKLVSDLSAEGSCDLISYVKSGDQGYDKSSFAAQVKKMEKNNSFMQPVAQELGWVLTEAARILDSGLSEEPTPDGEDLRNYWATKQSSPEIFWSIYRATPEELEDYLRTGKNYREKAISIALFIARQALVYELGPMKLAYTSASTDTIVVSKTILSQKEDVQITLLKVEEVNPLKQINRYSVRTRSKTLDAGKLVRDIVSILPNDSESEREKNQGGGSKEMAGCTVMGAFRDVLNALNEAVEVQLADQQ